jgi:hypothetical protein
MGYVPIQQPTVASCERDLRHRRSRLPWRRRRAYAACLWLIDRRELELGMRKPPSPPPSQFPRPTMQEIGRSAERTLRARPECPCVDGPCPGCVEHTRMGDRHRRFMRVAARPAELPSAPDPALVRYVERV